MDQVLENKSGVLENKSFLEKLLICFSKKWKPSRSCLLADQVLEKSPKKPKKPVKSEPKKKPTSKKKI